MAIEETTKMNLNLDVTVNGKKYKRGMNVEVPKAQADDIARIVYDQEQQRANLIRQPQTFNAKAGIDPLTNAPWQVQG